MVNINLEHTARRDRVVRATVAEAMTTSAGTMFVTRMAGVRGMGLFEIEVGLISDIFSKMGLI